MISIPDFQKVIAVAAISILLAACQTLEEVRGQGEIALSDDVVLELFLKRNIGRSSRKFIVSADGNFMSGVTLTATSVTGPSLQKVLDDCANLTSMDCHVIIDGNKLVWNGPVTFGSTGLTFASNSNGRELFLEGSQLSDILSCRIAIRKTPEGFSWSEDEERRNFIRYLQERGKSAEECALLSSEVVLSTFQYRELITRGTLRRASNRWLCDRAVSGNNWHPGYQRLNIVREAQWRGLTPTRCNATDTDRVNYRSLEACQRWPFTTCYEFEEGQFTPWQ